MTARHIVANMTAGSSHVTHTSRTHTYCSCGRIFITHYDAERHHKAVVPKSWRSANRQSVHAGDRSSKSKRCVAPVTCVWRARLHKCIRQINPNRAAQAGIKWNSVWVLDAGDRLDSRSSCSTRAHHPTLRPAPSEVIVWLEVTYWKKNNQCLLSEPTHHGLLWWKVWSWRTSLQHIRHQRFLSPKRGLNDCQR